MSREQELEDHLRALLGISILVTGPAAVERDQKVQAARLFLAKGSPAGGSWEDQAAAWKTQAHDYEDALEEIIGMVGPPFPKNEPEPKDAVLFVRQIADRREFLEAVAAQAVKAGGFFIQDRGGDVLRSHGAIDISVADNPQLIEFIRAEVPNEA